MGKVKAHRNRLVFVLGIKYQFPMGKVKVVKEHCPCLLGNHRINSLWER